jgi:hypothetical protein
MKLDAHCSVAEGFDLALLEAAEGLGRAVLQVPTQKNLHVFDWTCTACGWREYQGPAPTACPTCQGPVTREIVWRPRRGTTSTQWYFDADLHFRYYDGAARAKAPPQSGDYPPTMSLLGACWFGDRRWILDDLEGLDEQHGSWGQMGTELACKAWLSGGRVVCNRRTWFAHLFRTRADFSFPYPIKHAEQEAARAYSRRLWTSNAWPKQIRPLETLVAQFAPVPGWAAPREAPALEAPPAHPIPARASTTSAGILYYTDARGDGAILEAVRRQLRHAAEGAPIVAVSLPPEAGPLEAFDGMRHVIIPAARGYLTMTRQILTGLELLATDVVYFCEHDCLYPVGHFAHRPSSSRVYAYAWHTWKVDAESGRALHYRCEQLSGLCADRALLVDHYRRRLAHLETHGFSRRLGFEPGKPIKHGGLDDVPREGWWHERPIVDIRHGHNLTPSRWRKEQFRDQRYTAGWTESESIPTWGTTAGRFRTWLDEVTTHGRTE